MKLRFYARGTALVSLPDERRIVGQHARYVGRKAVPQNAGEGVTVTAYPATDEPYECEAESSAGRRLKKQCGKHALWPADEATAAFCAVEFQPLEKRDGEWLPKPIQASEPRKGSSKKAD